MRKLSSAKSVLVWLAVLALAPGCASVRQLSQSKQRARMLVEVANGALMEGDPTGALNSLKEAETLDDSLPELHHSLALAFHSKGETERALAAARRAIELKPNYAEANNTLGKLLIDSGDYVAAESPLKVAADDPYYREAFKAQTNLGILYYRRGETTKAAESLDRAIKGAPQIACMAHYYRGHVYLLDSKLNDAVQSYDRATQRLCAGFADAHFALGIAYVRNKQYDLARKKFLEIRQRYPNTKLAEQAMDRLRYLP